MNLYGGLPTAIDFNTMTIKDKLDYIISNGFDIFQRTFTPKKIYKSTKQNIIFSDIDDTILVNEFALLPRNIIFPGVKEVYNHLTDLPIIILTARSSIKGTEMQLKKLFGNAQKFIIFYRDAKYLKAYPNPTDKQLGLIKYSQFLLFMSYFPELNPIFFGDNTQGDELAGELMLEHNHNMLVFIQNIKKKDKPMESIFIKARHLKATRFYYFNTYIDVAKKLYSLKLIDNNEINYIIKSIKEELSYEIFAKSNNYFKLINNSLSTLLI